MRSRTLSLLAPLAIVALAAGCSEGSSGEAVIDTTAESIFESPPEPPSDFTIEDDLVVPSVVSFSVRPANADAQCRIISGDFFAASAAVDFRLHEARCSETGDMIAENGNRGQYATIDDVPESAVVGEVSFGATELGDFAAFEHLYVECTNECTEIVTPLVILEFDDPVVVDGVTYPSIILDGEPRVSTDDVIEVARSLRRDA